MTRHDGDLRLNDWFCGAGGSTQGTATIPGVRPVHAANHWQQAIDSHAANFPDVDHYRGDIRELDVSRLPYAELFWASPECTNWSIAKGVQQTYRYEVPTLPGLGDDTPVTLDEAERSRALMEEVPIYLRAMALRGKPVLAGVVENVTDVRKWTDWQRWRREIEAVGYRTRLVALNSMHAQSRRTPRAPQSRDRLYLAYWHVSLGRDPDWNKWLRPSAWCATCERWVNALQVFKQPGADMGRYRQQYVYRCPNSSCRNAVVEPAYAPASDAIDWTVRGERIGDRKKPLADKTMARIAAGIAKFARPITLEAAGNTFERRPGVRTWPVDAPLTTLHTTASKAIAVPPLLVPVEGRDGKMAQAAARPMRTQSTRAETALVVAPFIAELRGGGSVARQVSDPLATVTASGNHHGLVVPPAMVMRNNGSRGDGGEHCTAITDALRTLTTAGHQSLVTWGWDEWAALYRYDSVLLGQLTDPLPTQTTIAGDALIQGVGQLPDVDDCMFRMLEPHEIGAGMAFFPDYVVLGNRRQRVRQFGNAVTPPAAEVLMSALVEAITGEDIAA